MFRARISYLLTSIFLFFCCCFVGPSTFHVFFFRSLSVIMSYRDTGPNVNAKGTRLTAFYYLLVILDRLLCSFGVLNTDAEAVRLELPFSVRKVGNSQSSGCSVWTKSVATKLGVFANTVKIRCQFSQIVSLAATIIYTERISKSRIWHYIRI